MSDLSNMTFVLIDKDGKLYRADGSPIEVIQVRDDVCIYDPTLILPARPWWQRLWGRA